MNQARLALAAKYDFTEAELSDHYRSPIGSRRDLSLFQVNFYGFLQEFILRELECGGHAVTNSLPASADRIASWQLGAPRELPSLTLA